jgi:hypothetical protein
MGKSQKRFGDISSWTKLIEVVRFDFFLKGGFHHLGKRKLVVKLSVHVENKFKKLHWCICGWL